ncbi:MAG TPA: ABC transporter ATP-binding protein [Gaiellaceae bacterium]|nr:ABC transporter ATP-binding protein [Gaiellaceae bacterium]
MAERALVVTEGLGRDFRDGETVVHALRDVDLELGEGALTVVHGRSGSGKTTLLNMIGGLDRPTRGRVWLDGEEISAKGEDALVEVRREKIGFVFQSFGLVPILTAAENIEVPLRLRKVEPGERVRRVRELLELVGLAGRARHRPYELSGGEQQRVAICRALANRPRLLIADEPTAQLDSANALTIMEFTRDLVASEGVSAVVATHDPLLLDVADAVVELRDGRLVGDGRLGVAAG